jgi:hypothetical protein
MEDVFTVQLSSRSDSKLSWLDAIGVVGGTLLLYDSTSGLQDGLGHPSIVQVQLTGSSVDNHINLQKESMNTHEKWR